MDKILSSVVIFVIAYLLGSIPTAYLIGRLRGINIFEIGSGNMGATNMIRATGRIYWGALVWFLDSAKSVAAVLIALRLMQDSPGLATVVSSVAVILGHNWSIFVAMITGQLRGGKGAAAAFGTLLVVAPLYVIAAMLIFFGLILAATRLVSLGVLMMFGLAIVWLGVLIAQQAMPSDYIFYLLAITILILIRFRENIERLLAGTERRLGEHA